MKHLVAMISMLVLALCISAMNYEKILFSWAGPSAGSLADAVTSG